jgi:hypothetical protein
VRGWTDRATQYNAARPEWPIARRICGAEDGNHWNTKRCGQVHRAGIAADEDAGAAREGN